MSRFSKVKYSEPLEIPTLYTVFQEDTFDRKINLGTTTYRNKKGQLLSHPEIKILQEWMAEDDAFNKEYLPILGLQSFCFAARTLLLGPDNLQISNGEAFSVQCLSKVGALRIGAECLHRVYKYNTFYYSQPSCENYPLIFKAAGFKNEYVYRYLNPKTKGFDLKCMLEDLDQADKGSVIILQLCSHYPTGCDPTDKDWEEICETIKKNELLPFFDATFLGFASGDIEKDAWPVRYFAEKEIDFLCALTFSKNMGLCNSRIGNLILVMNSTEENIKKAMLQNLMLTVRGMYSNPPNYGARIATHILNNIDFNLSWRKNLSLAVKRVNEIREKLKLELEIFNTPGTWDHITSQRGLFAYLDLTERQVENLIFKYHIYLRRSGGINLSGLDDNNIKYVAEAISESIKKFPKETEEISKI